MTTNLIPTLTDIRPFYPEAALILTAIVVLLIPIFSPKKNILAVAVATAVGLAFAFIAVFYVRPLAMDPTSVFGGLLTLDPMAWFAKFLIILFTGGVLALWFVDSIDRMTSRGQAGDAPEFFLLLLVATTGMLLMTTTSNLLMIFLAVEMASLPSYVLAGFRKTHRPGAEAALKYVLFGAASAAIMLYGMSMLYGLFGTLDLTRMSIPTVAGPNHIAFILGTAGILVGVGFKIAMVPMHFWCPDVFEGTSIDITTFLSVASKAAGLALLMRVLVLFTGPNGAAAGGNLWLAATILVIGAITCSWGNLGAYTQTNIKRLLAFSSIGHAGYMLIAMAAIVAPATLTGKLVHSGAIDALLFYLFMYVFMNAGVFITAAAIAQRISTNNSTGENLADYVGLSKRAPILAGAMMLFCLSLVGIPLTIGFATKLKVFEILFNTHHAIGYIGLAVVGLNTVIGAFYYFRIIKAMYLQTTELPRVIEIAPATVLAVVLAVPNIALFLGYNYVNDFAKAHASITTTSTPALPTPSATTAPAIVAAETPR